MFCVASYVATIGKRGPIMAAKTTMITSVGPCSFGSKEVLFPKIGPAGLDQFKMEFEIDKRPRKRLHARRSATKCVKTGV